MNTNETSAKRIAHVIGGNYIVVNIAVQFYMYLDKSNTNS